MHTRKHTTIIIITYCHNDDVIQKTIQCFEAVFKSVNQYAPCSYDILVVDNNSNDKFKDWLRRMQEVVAIKIIWNPENYKFARAANQGLLAASEYADYCVLLNNDTIPRLGWLYSMIQVAELDPMIAVVGAKIMKPGTELVLHTGTLLQNGKVCDPYSALTPNHMLPTKIVEERLWINGACMLIKSEIIKKFGVFDDKEFDLYFEEADYMTRLQQAGYRTVYAPMAEIEHYEKTTAQTIPNAADSFYANWVKLESKHGGYWHWRNNLDGSPKVAIITPVYNGEKYVNTAIQGVFNQTYPNWKLYLVDDCSTDNTRAVLDNAKAVENTRPDFIDPSRKKSDRVFIIHKNENGGVSDSRNAAINTLLFGDNLERFKYVFFLDADDVWTDPTYIEKMVFQMERYPEIDMLYALCDKKFETGQPAVPFGIPSDVTIFDKKLMLDNNYIYVSFVGIKTNVVKDVGKFNKDLNGIEEWDYWSRVANAGYNIQCYPEVLGTYLVRGEGNAKESNPEKLKLLRDRQNKNYKECI